MNATRFMLQNSFKDSEFRSKLGLLRKPLALRPVPNPHLPSVYVSMQVCVWHGLGNHLSSVVTSVGNYSLPIHRDNQASFRP